MKILIIHASAGAGHTKAAEALYKALQDSSCHQVLIVDSLDYTNSFYKKVYKKSYSFLVTRIPWVWGFFFQLVDLKILRPVVKYLRRFINHMNGGKLERFLIEKDFDWVFSTHFFSNEVLSYLKRKQKIHSKIVSVITDFDVHSIWVAQGIDYYSAACDFTKKRLLQLGVRDQQILVAGIPTDQKFSQKRDKAVLRRKLGLKEDVFTVLVATGSFGIGPIEQIIKVLKDFQVVVVCGHNQKLYEKLKMICGDAVKICGLVDNMDELMVLSDCMITKPGGLSISEALVSQLPLIFFNAIPGQETHNIQVLKQYGVGTKNCTIEEMVQELKSLSSSAQRLKQVKDNTSRLASPSAASRITNLIYG